MYYKVKLLGLLINKTRTQNVSVFCRMERQVDLIAKQSYLTCVKGEGKFLAVRALFRWEKNVLVLNHPAFAPIISPPVEVVSTVTCLSMNRKSEAKPNLPA